MRTRKLAPSFGSAALTLTVLALASSQALAAEVWLKAGATTINLPDPNGGSAIVVPVWGYASCTDGTFGSCGPFTIPGPALTVRDDDVVAGLTVHLLNSLAVPTSIVINGLFKPMTPVWDNGATGSRPLLDPPARVRSFDTEAQPNGGTQADYIWLNVKPGTYLYQSGTQPQVQVQMGLYGAVTKNAVEAAAGVRAQSYAGTANEYDNQATLLYSEIDPALHAAVGGATPTYGTAAWTSTFSYDPKYFLINGAPYQYGSTPAIVPAGNAGTTLLRLLNAGLTTHVPTLQGKYWDIIAEDGKPYPYKRNQYTALMPAAKTLDLLLTPDIGGASYPILDRRLNLSNAGAPNGGMLAFLSYGAAGVVGAAPGDTNLPPSAVADSYSSIAGVELSVGVAQGVLANDDNTDGLPQTMKAVAASGATTAGGTYTLNANGSFSYNPPASIATDPTVDTFAYTITDGKALSAPATVSITLSAPVAPPVTVLDAFDRAASTAGLGADWAQAVSTASPVNVQLDGTQALAAATDLGGQAIWVKDTDASVAVDTSILGATQYAAFTSSSLANLGLILKATGGNAKEAPANFVRVRLEGSNFVVATQVGGGNTPVYVKQAAFPATGSSSGTLSAVVDAKGLVTVFLNGAYQGGVQLPDVGVWKGTGRIGIQLQILGATVDNFSGGTL